MGLNYKPYRCVMLLHSISFIHVYAVYTSEIAVNLRQCPSVSTRNARIVTKTYRHRPQAMSVSKWHEFFHKDSEISCANTGWSSFSPLRDSDCKEGCWSVFLWYLFYFLKRALKALRVVISEPTPLRDRQSLSDSMERIAK